jgi:hypothetical protein
MTPPIFDICADDPALALLLGSAPFRLFPAGDAPQAVARPYVTWQTISGQPANYLAQTPDLNSYTLQVDAYDETAAGVRQVVAALFAVIEQHAHVVALRGETREMSTRLYRSSFDVEWFVER